MTLRAIFGTLILFLLFVIYSLHTSATPKRKAPMYKIFLAPKPSPYEGLEITSAKGNKDGTVTFTLLVCGSTIYLTMDEQSMREQDPEIERVAQKAVDEACGKGK